MRFANLGIWTCALGLGLAACSSETERTPGTRSDASVAPDSGVTEEPDAGEPEDAAGAEDATPIDAGEMDAGMSTTGPIEAPDDTWTWVDFPDAKCINNSPTGIGVNLHPGATKALIFLMGGNACFNQASCFVTANLDGYDASDFANEIANVGGASLFDRAGAASVFKDYHFVFVPYCTGDVHGGSNPNGSVAGSSYAFVGHDNMGAYLDRLVPTFDSVTEVVLAGVSAGGFGAMLNFEQVQQAFGSNVRVTLIDDSGPPMGNSYLAPCLQAHFRDTWGFDNALLTNCAACASTVDNDWIEPYFAHIMGMYPDRNFAVISSDGDEVIRGFWGFGQNECRNLNDIFPPAYPAANYRAGLEDFRDNLAMGLDNVGLYMKTNSTQHTFLGGNIRNVTEDGVTLEDWLKAAIDDDMTWDHVPSPE